MMAYNQEKDCCGCGACVAVCPRGCITMESGTLGALFPKVNALQCVNCGKCEAVCPMTSVLTSNPCQQSFAAYAKNETVRFGGSSGGMFQTLAEKMMEAGACVYGAAFDEELKLRCQCAQSAAELKPLLKSKYLQSDFGDKYQEIKTKLNAGQTVMVTAAPCQIAALKNYLQKPYENLLTVDFLCHGVPSQKFFDQCKEYEENKRKCRMIGFQFRSKVKGGSCPHYYTAVFMRGGKIWSETKLYFHSVFYAAFQRYITLRESCYHCKFSGSGRCSDITIGDFHNIDNYVNGINRFDGVSMVIVNSEKGAGLWKKCLPQMQVISLELDTLIRNKEVFAGGTDRPEHRDLFVNRLQNETFSEVMAEFSAKKYWKQALYYHLPRPVRKLLKKVVLGD